VNKQNDSAPMLAILLAFVFLLGCVVGNCGGSIARAQAPVSPAVALARLCVNEAGTRAFAGDDCAAIYATIDFRSRRLYRSTFLAGLHRYSHRVTIDRGGRGRAWIAQLTSDGARPLDFPRSLRWRTRHREWWLRTLDHARAILRGEVRASCAPHGWARSDVRPADPSAHPIDCGSTVNVFWSVPAYAERWGDS
jgi:hypothetical protein